MARCAPFSDMPAKGKNSPACVWFWPRYAASLLLAAGVCYCVARTLDADPGEARHTVADATTVLSTPASNSAPAILIDPGHGGIDPGTVANGQFEKTWTMKVSRDLAIELRHRGW